MRSPSKTVKTGSVSGATVIVLVWVFGIVWPDIPVPPEVAAAATLIVGAVAAWIVPDPGRGQAKH